MVSTKTSKKITKRKKKKKKVEQNNPNHLFYIFLLQSFNITENTNALFCYCHYQIGASCSCFAAASVISTTARDEDASLFYMKIKDGWHKSK